MHSVLHCYNKENKYIIKQVIWLWRHPQNTGFAIALGCPPELDSKTLLLKVLHKLVTEHGTIKLVQIRKLPPQWLAFIVLEGAIQLLGWEILIILPSCEPGEL